eukprot:TRINITY_DN21406_c0_g1_i9.p1 TRINITY_DN21406_c0_g1~~TRINITY_DN21406_c0_g1_i9.p1  ORF type:complete len:594 (-),score=82.36 TRINITY_DN21406_c0_g1_i9:77-1858(-)
MEVLTDSHDSLPAMTGVNEHLQSVLQARSTVDYDSFLNGYFRDESTDPSIISNGVLPPIGIALAARSPRCRRSITIGSDSGTMGGWHRTPRSHSILQVRDQDILAGVATPPSLASNEDDKVAPRRASTKDVVVRRQPSKESIVSDKVVHRVQSTVDSVVSDRMVQRRQSTKDSTIPTAASVPHSSSKKALRRRATIGVASTVENEENQQASKDSISSGTVVHHVPSTVGSVVSDRMVQRRQWKKDSTVPTGASVPVSSRKKALRRRATIGVASTVENEENQQASAELVPLPPAGEPSRPNRVRRENHLKRDVCKTFRTLLFGYVGNESWPADRKAEIYEQTQGTNSQVHTLFKWWCTVEKDPVTMRWEVPAGVFLHRLKETCSRMGVKSGMAQRCVQFMVEMVRRNNSGIDATTDQYLPFESQLCSVEHLIRLLWLSASDDDVRIMKEKLQFRRIVQLSVPPPPVLSMAQRQEYRETFRCLDRKGKGVIAFEDLVDGDIICPGFAEELRKKYDANSDGTLQFEEFIEMICPEGFRPSAGVRKFQHPDGETMSLKKAELYGEQFEGWLRDSDVERLPEEVRMFMRSEEIPTERS